MFSRIRNRQRGFTLIELLIVVAIIGIIAAILIPNLLDALQKSKQKRTVADMRNLGTSWMSWLIDQVGAASAGQAKEYESTGFDNIDYDELFGYLHPSNSFFYMQEIPEADGWRYDLEFAMNPNPLASNVIIIGSGGRDGSLNAVEDTTYTVGAFDSTDYDQDIIWADGYFVNWPDNISSSGN